MPEATGNSSTAIELASMKQQLGHVVESIDELKLSINSLIHRNDKITELAIHSESHSKELATLWNKYDALKQAKDDDHEQFKRFIDSSRGAMAILKLFLVVFGAGITTAVGWVFYQVTVTATLLQVHAEQIANLARAAGAH